MRSQTVFREITAAGILLASYPLAWIVEQAGYSMPERLLGIGVNSEDPVILLHGLGGNRTNLFGLATYVRLAGFGNIACFEYPRVQSVANAAEHLADLIDEIAGDRSVHLVGHSLGGTIARRFASAAGPRRIRSLITLASPYRYDQHSPGELAIFGEEDPIVPPPLARRMRPAAVKRAVILPKTGHLGVLYHADTLRAVETELASSIVS
jgi:pimeloyl-ACP methyl ester carboxylesterase